MSDEHLKEVIRLVEKDCRVMLQGPYVDGFLNIWQKANGEWVFNSQVWAEQPLQSVIFGELSFWKQVEPRDITSEKT